ncbi:hypothetical protein B0J11DRAFT_598905 [Dendryphion nanum]|uniref:Uncharacterized protein n=1 Tax=Dendryphion nanum TaxID=256645 RepID=A0A9P9I947_9PLEO|nr:hypothetical protein B0J11DRAFT_598905 [Dendryphion nanum]
MMDPFLIAYATVLLVSLICSVLVTYRDFRAPKIRGTGFDFPWQRVLVAFDVVQDVLLLCSGVMVILSMSRSDLTGWTEFVVLLTLECMVCTNVCRLLLPLCSPTWQLFTLYAVAIVLVITNCIIHLVVVGLTRSRGSLISVRSQFTLTAFVYVHLVYVVVGSILLSTISFLELRKHRASGSYPNRQMVQLFRVVIVTHAITIIASLSGVTILIIFRRARDDTSYRIRLTTIIVSVGTQGLNVACAGHHAIERWVHQLTLGSDIALVRTRQQSNNTRPSTS